MNPAPNGYNAINFRAEGRTGSCFIATWQLGKISSGETSSGEAFSLNRAGLTGGTAYRADASQQWKTNGDSIFGFNVGIGTTTPSQKLEVVGGEIKAGRVDSTNEGGQVSFGRASDNATGWYIDVYGNTSTPSLRFVDVSNSAVRMTVDGCGNVGIATTSPAYKLDVSGATRVGSLLVSNTTTTTWCVGRIEDARANTWYTIYTWPGIYDGAFTLAQLGYEDNNGDGANVHAFWMTSGAAYSTGFSTSQIGGATNLCLQRSGQSLQALITGVTDRTSGAFIGYTLQTMIVAS
jgi:hypothetical protein